MAEIKKNSNIARVSATLDIGFFYKWLSFLTPFHKLTKAERQVLASFLNKRFQLQHVVRDESVLDNLLKSIDIRREIREDLNMTVPQFNILVSKLKKSGVMNDNKIDRHYIPNIQKDSDQYRLILIFDINGKEADNDLLQQRNNGDGENNVSET